MAHPYESAREVNPGRKAAQARVKAYAKGGNVDAQEAREAAAKRVRNSRSMPDAFPVGGDGYKVGGTVSAPRADKFARGGKAKGKHSKGTHINIAVVAPQKDKAEAPMMPPPGMPPSGGPPIGVPPGGGPATPPPMPPGMPGMKRGGKVAMKGGGDSGQGRLDKIKAYGAKDKKG